MNVNNKISYESSSDKLAYYYKRDSSITVINLSGLPVPRQICQLLDVFNHKVDDKNQEQTVPFLYWLPGNSEPKLKFNFFIYMLRILPSALTSHFSLNPHDPDAIFLSISLNNLFLKLCQIHRNIHRKNARHK